MLQVFVRRVHNRVHGQRRDVALYDLQRGLADGFLHRREPLPQNGVERIMKTILPFCAVALLATTASARVKLVALPERARIVVSLTNPEGTLVEEERVITLQKGVN